MVIMPRTTKEEDGTYKGYVVGCTPPGSESPILWEREGFKSRAAAMKVAKSTAGSLKK